MRPPKQANYLPLIKLAHDEDLGRGDITSQAMATATLSGQRPVSVLARDGLHDGAGQCALEKSVPLRANRSRLGVWTGPAYPPSGATQSFTSSTTMKSTSKRRGHDPPR